MTSDPGRAMSFADTPDEAAFRRTARDWLAAHAPRHLERQLVAAAAKTTSSVNLPDLGELDALAICKAWQRQKFESGWACLHWPREFGGRDATPIERVIWQQEEGVYAQLSTIFAVSHGMVGPTLMKFGTGAQKQQRLRPTAAGVELWCQLFSEPSAGSDLAALGTRAERDNGDWIVNGQKIWTSHAQIADFGLLLVRTDPTAPKHRGLTMFMLDMTSAGITVQPIKQITGETSFNQVFLADLRISDSARIGEVNEGWVVALTTLMNERLMLGLSIPTGVMELLSFCQIIETPDGRAIDDRAVRSRLASWIVRANGLKFTMMRTVSALSQGAAPGPESSIGKLVAGDMVQDIAAFAMDLSGAAGSLMQTDDSTSHFQHMLLRSASVRVGGGTAEIQRNIIAERVLGLPADIRIDKAAAWNAAAAKR